MTRQQEVDAHTKAMTPTNQEVRERIQLFKTEDIQVTGITGERYAYDISHLLDQAYGKIPYQDEILFCLKYIRKEVLSGTHADEFAIPPSLYLRHAEALLYHIENQGGVS